MNILVTSAGRRTYFISYLKEIVGCEGGMVHAANSCMTHTLTVADSYLITPEIYSENYINTLIDYCKNNEITLIISLFDIDLPVLAKNRNRFEEQGIIVVGGDYTTTQICNDKWRTFNFLISNGLPAPNTLLYNDKLTVSKFPLIVKPRWGMGSMAIMEVESNMELKVAATLVKRKIFSSYLKHESQADKDNSVIVQQKIEGEEYGLDILNDMQGNFVTVVAKHKLAMRNGETDVAEIVDSKPFDGVAKRLSELLCFTGNLDVDLMVDSSGDFYILEMNCRFGGQYPFTHEAGANYVRFLIDAVRGNDQKTIPMVEIGAKFSKDIVPVRIK